MTRLLVAIMLSFTILTTPNTYFNFVFSFSTSQNFYKTTSHFVNALASNLMTLNYSLNFYLYCFANMYKSIRIYSAKIDRILFFRDFRVALFQVLSGWRLKFWGHLSRLPALGWSGR